MSNDRRKADRRRLTRGDGGHWITARAVKVQNVIITQRAGLENYEHGSLSWQRQDSFIDGLEVALNIMTGRIYR